MSPTEINSTEKPGARIGRYKLVEQIGEGGFGTVWMAEQEEPVKRRVALKVLKLGMDTKQVVARFEAERQALALMDHEHIAKVLDGGATENGRPYFVMELVHGVAITKFCDEHKLGTRARLELFVLVCRAVQHAHQKGVIHRDLKPSNVLVALHDGKPAPKVIDFGIAKATAGSLTDRTLVTEYRQMLGTPEYMAPEQAEMSGLDIDTRADVYSLGVLLYELMTGTKPFELQIVKHRGYEEILRHIREVEPPKPSTRVSTLDDVNAVATRRGLAAPELQHALSGDLDWIAMKALEKDRARRYDTANALADDVRRHLDHQPVLASPPSASYRLRKFALRNKLAFAAGIAITLALVVGLGAATAGWLEARAQRDVARAQLERALRAEAEQASSRRAADAAREAESEQRLNAQASEQTARNEAAKSRQVAQFLTDMLKSVGPSVAVGRDTALLSEILDQTAERIDSELAGQPEVEADLRATIGEVYRELGRYPEALAMQREALRLRRETDGEESAGIAMSLNDLGLALYQRGEFAQAEEHLRESVEMLLRTAPELQMDRLAITANLAAAQTRLGKYAEAERNNREVLALQRELTGDESSDTAWVLNNLGALLRLRGDLAGAEVALSEALAIHRALRGDKSSEVAAAGANLATVLRARGRLDEAEALLREILGSQREVLGDEHPDIATTTNNLACVLFDRERFDEAEPLFEKAVAMRRALLGHDNVEVARPLEWLATLARKRGAFELAEQHAREALGIYEGTLGADHPDAIDCLDTLAHIVEETGALDDAEVLVRRAHDALRNNPEAWRRNEIHTLCYPQLLQRRQQWQRAESVLLDTWTRVAGEPKSARNAMVAEGLAQFYEAWNQAEPSAERVAQAQRWRDELAKLPPLH